MRRRICLFLGLLCLPLLVLGQRVVKGTVLDEESVPLPYVVVRALDAKDEVVGQGLTDLQGRFSVEVKTQVAPIRMVFAMMGYAQQTVALGEGDSPLHIVMKESEVELKEVTVKVPTVIQRSDTITYNVGKLKDAKDRTIEDVLRKIPGIEIDASGRILYQGESINRFYIQNMDMLGGRYGVASKNIRADDVASVSVYENHQPKRVLQDVQHSSKAALNLTLKRDRLLKPIGTMEGGAGYGDEVLWDAALTSLFISPKRQFLVAGKTNSTGGLLRSESQDFFENAMEAHTVASDKLKPLLQVPGELDRKRMSFNHSYSLTGNSIFLLKDDVTLAANVGYNFDRDKMEQQKTESYWLPGLERMVVDEHLLHKSVEQNAWLTLKLESNKSRAYFSDALKVQGEWADIAEHVNIPVHQNMRTGDYNIKNSLDWIFRKADKVYDFHSEVCWTTVPDNVMLARDVVADTTIINQKLSGYRFYTNEYSTFRWLLSDVSTLSMKVSLHSYLDKLKSDNDGGALCRSGANDVTGLQLQTCASPSYQYKLSKFLLSAELPLYLENMRFDNRISDVQYSFDRLWAGMHVGCNYSVQSYLKLAFSSDFRRVMAGMTAFLDAPIYQNYRSVQQFATNTLDVRDRGSASLSLTYRNVLNGFNSSVRASASRLSSKNKMALDVAPGQLYAYNAEGRSVMNQWTLMSMLSKNFFDINTLFALHLNANFMTTDCVRQGLDSQLSLANYELKATGRSVIIPHYLILDFEGRYDCCTQQFEGAHRGRQNMYAARVNVSVFPVAACELYVSAEVSKVQGSTEWPGVQSRNVFADAGMRYSFRSVELELNARNLTNRRCYYVSDYSETDAVSYVSFLHPLSFWAKVRFSF